MRLRIVGKGMNCVDWRVENAETGEMLENVVSLKVEVGTSPDGAIATIVIQDFDMEAEVYADVDVRPELGVGAGPRTP